jgi:hypothetical protein
VAVSSAVLVDCRYLFCIFGFCLGLTCLREGPREPESRKGLVLVVRWYIDSDHAMPTDRRMTLEARSAISPT